jgi:hypothetical protein
MNDFLHNMVDTGDRILSTNCHTDIFGSGNVHRQGTEIRLSDLPTLKMTVLRTTCSVVLHLGRFFSPRGQNFPLQLTTVEVAGPHKNT